MLNVKQTHEDIADVLDEVRFAENREPRCACVALFDTSDSMKGDSIAQLNKGFAQLLSALNGNDLASLRVELGVITFGGTPKIVQDFDSVDRIELREFSVSGNTPLGEAVRQGFTMLDERKAMYKANGVPYYRPWMFLLTDGQPTDDWEKAADTVHEQERGKHVVFFAVGVDNANMEILKKISVREPRRLKDGKFAEMFEWLSTSLSDVANSNPGDEMRIRPADGWGTISAA